MIYSSSYEFPFVYWGMNNRFSRLVLQNLLENNLRPSSVFLPGPGSIGIEQILPNQLSPSVPILSPFLKESLAHLVWNHGIPLYQVADLSHPDLLKLMASLNTKAAIVVCFPKRIPIELRAVPDLGFINLHPSMLPLLRGPYPLFWTFRLGVQPGITLHCMEDSLDTGNLIRQETVDFPSGIGGQRADQIMANAGAEMICSISPQLKSGKLISFPQEGNSSTYSAPTAEDFTIPTSWTTERAFNFIRGTAEWNHPYSIQGPGINIKIRTAEGYVDKLEHPSQSQTDDSILKVQFKSGILYAR